MKPVNALDEALSALWVARRQLSAQMDQIDKAIDALRALDGVDRPATAAKTKIAVAGGTKTKRKGLIGLPAQSVECDVCGLPFKSVGGVAVHKARAHGAKKNWASRKKAKPEQPVAAAPIDPPADEAERFGDALAEALKNPRKALICESCGYTTPTLNAEVMNKHTLAEHQRIASRAERLPKAV